MILLTICYALVWIYIYNIYNGVGVVYFFLGYLMYIQHSQFIILMNKHSSPRMPSHPSQTTAP